MSQQLINHSNDLKKLRDEGYDIEIRASYLLLKHVPYVNSKKEVKLGILVSELTLADNVTIRPNTHVIYFTGEYPCNRDGIELDKIRHQNEQKTLTNDLMVKFSFSSKPSEGYKDFYDKMTTYAAIISSPAQSIDSNMTAKIFPVVEFKDEESVFKYLDTASSRAEINSISEKLKQFKKVAIVGLGGTGSYVLDLVAKTLVKEIHLFDGDKFSQHNAFRSPGAPSGEELKNEVKKVNYFADIYSKIHNNIIPHGNFIDVTNVDQLHGMDFVFLCLDKGEVKKLIIEKLEEFGISFLDVGMGINNVDNSLSGILRVTLSTPEKRDHVKSRISFSDIDENNEYSRNIQIADLNALNASLAVIKWKKLAGFYSDLEREYFSTYTIDGNKTDNAEQYETQKKSPS